MDYISVPMFSVSRDLETVQFFWLNGNKINHHGLVLVVGKTTIRQELSLAMLKSKQAIFHFTHMGNFGQFWLVPMQINLLGSEDVFQGHGHWNMRPSLSESD